jgi:hypothetical protein
MFLILVIILCPFLSAQTPPGARETAICNAGVALSDNVFSIFNNPAGLAQLGWRETGVYYSPAPFGLPELANGYIAYSEPALKGTLSFGVMTYGYELYRENKFLLSYSGQIVKDIFIGTVINYQLVTIKNYGNDGAIIFNLGTLAYLSHDIRIGFDIMNLNRSALGGEKDQIPMIFDLGLSYNFSENLLLCFSINKDIRYRSGISGGLEYLIRDILYIRSGVGTEPFRYSGGTGIHFSHFSFDYAFSLHQELGITHQVSLIFSFSEFKNRTAAIRQYLHGDEE